MARKPEIQIESHAFEYKSGIESRIGLILEALGIEASGIAQENLRNSVSEFATGNLENRTTYYVDKSSDSVYIGTNVEYGIYVELGTGIYASEGNGRKTPWMWVDEKGVGHWTHGIKPKHFLKRAITEHISDYEKIIEDGLK